MKYATRILAAVLTVASLSVPFAASAMPLAPASRTLVLTSRIVQALRAGEIDGRMRLTISRDGTLTGSYRDEDTGAISDVTGGVDAGNKLWLDIGDGFGRFHFTGTLTGTTIDASAYHGVDDLHLIATSAT